jgi:tRNA A-37 threonylcarbamoyl transferase component Bud32
MLPVNRKRPASSFSLTIFAYGAQLIRRIRVGGLSKVTSSIESIKINAINLEMRGNRLMWIKRRQLGSGVIAVFANLFFFLARARIHLWINLKKWQTWEVACFQLLYGPTLQVFAEGGRTVCIEMVPGKSLREWVIESTFAVPALRAAGKELRRAHDLWCSELADYWSHGDPHLENLIYDLESGQARLIDFELIHDKSLSAIKRHADDLLVVLQDLMACVSREQWVPFSMALIEAYNQPLVLDEVRRRLIVPRGWSAIWWKLRTDYVKRSVMVERIETLNTALSLTAKKTLNREWTRSHKNEPRMDANRRE